MNNSIPPGPSNNHFNGGNADNSLNGTSFINIFKEICGVDDETATQLLRESGGNLEAAIHQYFYTHEHQEIIQNQNNHEGELRRRHLNVVDAEEQEADQIVNNVNIQPIIQHHSETMSWGQWLHALVIFPFRFFYSTFTDCLIFFYNIIMGPPQRGIGNEINENRRAIQGENVIQDRILMQQQQDEYNLALAIDREKMLKRKRQENERVQKEQREMEETERLKARSERLKQKRKEIAEKIQPEPESSEQDLVRIRISFPNGTKIEKRFRHQDNLERLFETVFVHSECPEDFSLLTSYPSIFLECAPEWYKQEFGIKHNKKQSGQTKTFAQQGLVTSAVIIIQDNEA